jgi:glycosyltransferase involved in cell wall biosynthesis
MRSPPPRGVSGRWSRLGCDAAAFASHGIALTGGTIAQNGGLKGSIGAIIPTFERRVLLAECIDSVLRAGDRVREVIVVNDGSSDDTSAFVRSLGGLVVLVDKPNGGKSSALNLGLSRCTSDYVWICDDDDLAVGDGVERLAQALDADPAAGFAFGRYNTFTDTAAGRLISPPYRFMRDGEPNAHLQFLEEMFTFQYATLVRRELYGEVGPFDEALIRSQDLDMMIRLARRAKSIYVPTDVFLQRAHGGQRGSAAVSFAVSDNARRWLQFDQRIYARIRTDYRLEEFTPTFALDWDGPRAARAALLQRACIFAARAMWPEAIDDLAEAAASTAAPATPAEVLLAEAVIRSPLAWEALGANPAWRGALRGVWKSGVYGSTIVEACCRPLVWQARQMLNDGDLRGAAGRLKTMLEVLSLTGGVRRLSRSAFA